MHDEPMDILAGQIAAMSMTLRAVMRSLDGQSAAHAAMELAMALEEAKHDEEDQKASGHLFFRTRNTVAQDCIDLLLSNTRQAG